MSRIRRVVAFALCLAIIALAARIGHATEIISPSYSISTDRVEHILKVDSFADSIITLKNLQGNPLHTTVALKGNITGVVRLDKSELSVNSGSSENLKATLFGESPGVFNGSIQLKELNAEIPVQVTVYDPDLVPVSALYMEIYPQQERLFVGEPFKVRVNLYNTLVDKNYTIELVYTVAAQDANSSTKPLVHLSEEVFVKTSSSLLREFPAGDNLSVGTYTMRIDARYLNLTSSSSTVFFVTKPFYMYTFIGIEAWKLAAGAILIGAGTVAYLIYRKQEAGKKRYQMKLDLNLLPKPGPRSGYMGKIAETEQKTYLDLDSLTTHAIVAGSTGGGKTIAAQDIIEEALIKGIAIVVFDPTAQWSGMLRKCESKNFLDIYPQFGMKPTDARAFNGNVRAISDAREVIDLKKYLKPGEIQIFTVNKLDPKDIDIFVANTVREVFHANFGESPNLKYMLVYDEVHRLLPKFGGSGEGFIQIERACREFRKWGIGVLLISQVLADFVGQIKANINTEIQMRTRDEGDLKRIATKYGTDQLKSLVRANVGAGMIQNAAYNRGLPYFVQFRPILHSVKRLSDEELDQYNKYNGVIDDCEFQLEQLEQLGMDVFDMKLELKLALDKVKSGSFNMVDIYLEGLTSRLKNEWAKLGKTPKKKTLTLINADALKEELERAKMEHDKAVKDAGVAAGAAAAEQKTLLFEKVFKPLTFDNGAMVSTLIELSDALKGMDDETFKSHVNDRKNDVHAWFRDVVKDAELAEKIKPMNMKEEIIGYLDKEKKLKRTVSEQNPAAVAATAAVAEQAKAIPPVEASAVEQALAAVKQSITAGNVEGAQQAYGQVNTLYKGLSPEDKKRLYPSCAEAHKMVAAATMFK